MYNFNCILEVLKYYKQNFSDREIESITGISKSTCNKWKHDYYDNYDNLCKRYNKQHLDKEKEFIDSLEKDIFDYINKIVEENPFVTYGIFISLINKEFDIKLNNTKMKFLLKNLNITKKRVRQRTIKTENFLNQLIENRKKFRETIKKEIIENIISIDESSFNKLLNSNTKGYSKKGDEINIPIPELKLKNTSLLMALSVNGIINSETTLESIDANIYFNFINDTIKKLKLIEPDTKFIFIYDNVPFHKDKTINDLIINNGYKIYNIPAYSPNLNPIENVFGILKENINQDILNDMLTNNFFINYEKINKENNHNRKINNKKITIEEKNNEKMRILEFKKNNKKVFSEIVNNEIIKTKEDPNILKEELKNKIKEIKAKYKKEKQKTEKEYVTKEKNNTKKILMDKKEKKATILKEFIANNVKKFNEKYKKEKIIKIFQHAFNYDHQNIEKELRDRIKINNK